MRRWGLAGIGGIVVLLLVQPSSAYQFAGRKWPTPTTAMYVSMGSPWDAALTNAMALWSQSTVFQFTSLNQVADPCSNPNSAPVRNGTTFSATTCGEDFGATTLAVTLTWSSNSVARQAGIIFNTKYEWSVYNGPWVNSTADFQRVAVHELGHVIGLDHENSAQAIMASAVVTGGTIIAPTADDIAGVNALYGTGGSSDATAPTLTITSHTNNQTVTAGSIFMSGAASDSGRGDSGISSVTVNGFRASADTASGSGTANWASLVYLTQGPNAITVVARDNSSARNSTIQTITIVCGLPPPANDNFSSAFNLSGASGATTGNNACASRQTGEPFSEGQNSVWWRWTAPSTGGASFDTAGSNFDTFLGVYTGNSISALTTVGQNDDRSDTDFTSQTSFTATAGVTYYIAVTGFDSESGNIRLNWQGPGLTSGTSGVYHIFPQVADGRMSDGSYYRTTLMISNPTSTAGASCTFRLYGLTVNGSSAFTYTMAASGWVISSTSGAENFRSGYATLQCSAPVEAQLLYSYYYPDGIKISEATVFPSAPVSNVQILADSREGARIGLAVANDSDQATTYVVSAYNSVGVLVGTTNLVLPARSARASFVDELIPVLPGNFGQVFVSSSGGAASIIGFRFTGGAFTTIPATTRSVTSATARTYHVFPQYADGRMSDGSYYRTTLMVSNPSGSAGGSCTFRLYGLTVGNSNVSTYNIGPSVWVISQSSGTQSFRSGYATLQCSASVEAQLLYSFYSASGIKLSEATVFSSPAGATTQILVDSREGAQVGLAVANDSDSSVNYLISVYNASGGLVGTKVMAAPPRSAQASFVRELIPLPLDHYGPVVVSGAAGSIIGLRYTGPVFTTIPETIR